MAINGNMPNFIGMKGKKNEGPPRPKKNKYDITVKLDMPFEEAIKLAANTPPKKKVKDAKKKD